MVGTLMEIYVNAVKIGSVTDGTFAGTKVGIQTVSTTAQFRYFTVRTA
jgi:hypothetical protein